MTTRTTNWLRGERGSVPLALLVVIIMAGLTSVVMSRAVAEQRSTRFDNEYTTAMHAAEAGLEEAAFAINTTSPAAKNYSGTGRINGYDYTWWAQQQADESWLVGSSGTGPDGVTRTVGIDLTDRPIFDLSLATHFGITFAGNNSADSYDSGESKACSGPTEEDSDPDCFGIIASNGDIKIGASGVKNYADQVHVYDWANNAGDGRCTWNGSGAQTNYCASPHRSNIDDALDIHAHVPLVEDMMEACDAAFPGWDSSSPWIASNNNGTLQRSGLSIADFDGHDDIDEVACVSKLVFDEDTEISAEEDDLVVVVADGFKLKGHVRVNCQEQCDGGFPVAGRLQLFTLAVDTDDVAAVQILQQARLAAGVYAPNASCGNPNSKEGGSGAQVQIYGSLICESLRNQGGWGFHYDAALRDGLTTGEYFVDRWREE